MSRRPIMYLRLDMRSVFYAYSIFFLRLMRSGNVSIVLRERRANGMCIQLPSSIIALKFRNFDTWRKESGR